jgi:hypothetical protein
MNGKVAAPGLENPDPASVKRRFTWIVESVRLLQFVRRRC